MRCATDSSGVGFSFDGDFHFHKDGSMLDGNVCGDGAASKASAMGCYFLSGSRNPMLIVWSDGEAQERFILARVMGRFAISRAIGELPDSVGICGPVCDMPDKVVKLCRSLSFSNIYVCPLVKGIAAFGLLANEVHEVRNRRIPLFWNNTQELDSECQLFDANLDGDGLGRMANLVAKGIPVLNDMLTTPQVDTFYGRVLSFKEYEEPIYLLRSSKIREVFQTESIPIRDYVATQVPIELNNTEAFEKETGCVSRKVTVMSSSEYIPGLPEFLRFLSIMGGKEWVISSKANSFEPERGIPVFRHHGGYRVDKEDYKEILRAR